MQKEYLTLNKIHSYLKDLPKEINILIKFTNTNLEK